MEVRWRNADAGCWMLDADADADKDADADADNLLVRIVNSRAFPVSANGKRKWNLELSICNSH